MAVNPYSEPHVLRRCFKKPLQHGYSKVEIVILELITLAGTALSYKAKVDWSHQSNI